MKNETLYNKTVDILVQAYLNDTLEHQNCYACAVGNMVLANNKGSMTHVSTKSGDRKVWQSGIPFWEAVFRTCDGKQFIDTMPYIYGFEARKQIDSTGYAWKDLAKIEYAFETAPKGANDDEWMFNGLMAVIEVLDQIHENTDAAITTAQKNRFVKSVTA